jgi:hypothetical protein
VRKYLALALLSLLCAPFVTRADGGTPVYDVTGTLVIPGNSTCGPSCSETLEFSLLAQYQFSYGEYRLQILPGSSIESTGPLDPFPTFANGGGVRIILGGVVDGNYLGLTNDKGDEIDITFNMDGSEVSASVPQIDSVDLFGCGSEACAQDICPYGAACSTQPYVSNKVYGTVTSTVTVVTPEPSLAALLLFGLASLWAVRFSRNVLSESAQH